MMEKTVEAIRIVTMDYYLAKPVQSLDPCYSELQNSVVKQVPVIRIFGSTRTGAKVCANVHGVLPYLYVPFDERSCDNVEKMIHLLASSLDKALNISLAKSNSKQQFVYKISIVKGIPFYGFHEKEEKYLKIYLLNPGLLKRTANLLLNSAVMGRSFQPHETHIPYILQFLVDHNLYGMSQLYIPSELITYRSDDPNTVEALRKTTPTANEIDFLSVHILNRILLAQQAKTGYGNPGIASIWEDEQIRRGVETITELQPPLSQVRGYNKITDSDQFYRDILRHRMLQMSENDLLGNESESTIHEEESTKSHSGDKPEPNPSSLNSNLEEDNLDQTIVNEEIALCFTQHPKSNDTLQAEDLELLEVMKFLEADQVGADEDSALAPFTQATNKESGSLNKTLGAIPDKTYEDPSLESDEELDFTMILAEEIAALE